MIASVVRTGPVFDGKAFLAAELGVKAVELALAEKARDRARAIQNASIKIQVTGAEPASLHVETGSSFGLVVTDDHNIKYGPWLEGTGSRNQTTRFKGYGALRQATEEIDMQAEAIAEGVMAPFIREMN